MNSMGQGVTCPKDVDVLVSLMADLVEYRMESEEVASERPLHCPGDMQLVAATVSVHIRFKWSPMDTRTLSRAVIRRCPFCTSTIRDPITSISALLIVLPFTVPTSNFLSVPRTTELSPRDQWRFYRRFSDSDFKFQIVAARSFPLEMFHRSF